MVSPKDIVITPLSKGQMNLGHTDAWPGVDLEDKYIICIDVDRLFYHFIIINTDPSPFDTPFLKVDSNDVSCLQHISHIDVAKTIKLDKSHVDGYLQNDPTRHKGQITVIVGKNIIAQAQTAKTLNPKQLKMIEDNL